MSDADEPKDKAEQTPAELVAECMAEISHAQEDEDYKSFLAEGTEAYKFYKNQGDAASASSLGKVIFNPFWSNVEILLPIYYARLPKLIGKRRFQDSGKRGRLACKILERCTDYSLQVEQDDFNQVVKMSIKDFIVVGRGNGRCFFNAEFEDAIDSQGQPYKKVIPFTERATTGYVYWKDYLTNRARNATEHRWRSHKSYMTRAELIERFGKGLGAIVPLDNGSSDKTIGQNQFKKDFVGKAEVWEKWRKSDKQVYWIAPSYGESPLEYKADPLRLDGFYPYPRPLTATTSTDSDIPTGQFKIDKGLLQELKEVCQQIADIERMIRVVGFHDKTMDSEIIKLRGLAQGQTTPVNFPQASTGNLQKAIEWFPFDKAVEALTKLIDYAEWLINKLWQQDGIPDIVRGASNPNETLGAQQLKSNFTVIRTSDKQQDVQRWIRDLLSMKAQIIFELFSDEMIMMMSGFESMTETEQGEYPNELALLRNDKLRTFYVDIETDSTIAIDEEEEKKSATEAFTALSQGINVAFQTMQMDPHLGIAMLQNALYLARRFRGARDFEDSLERCIDAKEKELNAQEQQQARIDSGQEQPPPPPVDPEQIKAEAQMQVAQMKQSLEEQKAGADMQLQQAITQHQMALEQFKATTDIQLKRDKLTQESILNEKELQLKSAQARMDMIEQALNIAKDDNARTAEKIKSEAGKTNQIPNITINMPSGKKLARATKDPRTGDFVFASEDVN